MLVIGVILWTAGFVDLFTHKSEPAQILGLYSIPFVVLLVVYASGFLFWYRMIISRNGVTRLKSGIRFIQQRAWLGILLVVVFAVIIGSMFILYERWVQYPLLQVSLLLLMVLSTAVILLAKTEASAKVETWRKVFIVIFGLIIGLEVVFQLLARVGALPFTNINGLYQQGARIYQNEEGRGYGLTNKYGWYYPEFRLEDGTTRIILTGDSFVHGLQVAPNENMGVVLDMLMNSASDDAQPFEVMTLGMPDYGPTIYLGPRLYPVTTEPLKPNEVVVLFHLANDFQSITASNGIIPYALINDEGISDVDPVDYELRHDLWHVTIRGYDAPNPVRIVRSHLFTIALAERFFQSVFNMRPDVPAGLSNIASASDAQPFGAASFMFEAAGNPRFDADMTLATKQLLAFKEAVEASGATLRLVTIPYFPAKFYAENQGTDWTADLGDYDLFLPDQALQQFAAENNIPFVSLGQYMQASGLSVEEIQALFFENGSGHFTVAGHEFVANALNACFYATTDKPVACAAQ